jgi:hypothetical protein
VTFSEYSPFRQFLTFGIKKIIPKYYVTFFKDKKSSYKNLTKLRVGLHFGRKFGLDTKSNRVARWCIFTPKILIWVYFGEPGNGKCWYTLWPFGIFSGHLVTFIGHVAHNFPVLVYFIKKNLATLNRQHCATKFNCAIFEYKRGPSDG